MNVIPRHLLTQTVTVWNKLDNDDPIQANAYQKTVIRRVRYSETDAIRIRASGLDDGNALLLYISLNDSEPQDGRTFIGSDDFDNLREDLQKGFYTVRSGRDFVTLGESTEEIPVAETVFRVMTVECKRTPDGRGFLRVVAQ